MQPQNPYQFGATPATTGGAVLASDAHKVLRNTYLLLALSMVPTVIGAFIGVNLDFSFMAQHPFIGALGMLAVAWGLMWAIAKNRDNGLGVMLLLGFTLFMGVILGPILQVALHLSNGLQLISLAAGGTGIIFFTLAGIVTVTKKDFSFMGQFLMIGAVLLLIGFLANAFFQIPALSLAMSGIAILVFSGFILYDVSKIIHGGETNYIMATLGLYLDIYNIFVNLLNILMMLSGRRD